MRRLALFLYGASVGLSLALLIATLAGDNSNVGWFAFAAAVTLALALTIHAWASHRAKGRRWRKTR